MSLELLVVHHTATSRDTSVEAIRRWHVGNNGWRDIGYHWLIRQPRDQDVASLEPGRPHDLDDQWEPWEHGAHARGANARSLGIAIIGDLHEHQIHPASEILLVRLLGAFCLAWGLDPAEAVRGHREVAPAGHTVCPGQHLDLDRLRQQVAFYLDADTEIDHVMKTLEAQEDG